MSTSANAPAIDLSGRWPLVFGQEWDENIFVAKKRWDSLSDGDRRRVESFLKRRGRIVRVSTVWDVEGVIHVPPPEPSRIETTGPCQVSFIVKNEWVRHHGSIVITVEHTEEPAAALRLFREWLDDMKVVGLAEVTGVEDEATKDLPCPAWVRTQELARPCRLPVPGVFFVVAIPPFG